MISQTNQALQAPKHVKRLQLLRAVCKNDRLLSSPGILSMTSAATAFDVAAAAAATAITAVLSTIGIQLPVLLLLLLLLLFRTCYDCKDYDSSKYDCRFQQQHSTGQHECQQPGLLLNAVLPAFDCLRNEFHQPVLLLHAHRGWQRELQAAPLS